jgi:hypothetical protein
MKQKPIVLFASLRWCRQWILQSLCSIHPSIVFNTYYEPGMCQMNAGCAKIIKTKRLSLVYLWRGSLVAL